MIDNLYTKRSYARCIGDGYRFLAGNLWMVTKIMAPYFLVASAFMVFFNAVNTHLNVADAAGKPTSFTEAIFDFAFLVLTVLTYIVAIRRLYIMFKRLCGITGPKRINFKKTAKAILKNFGKILGTTLLALFSLIVISAVVYIPYVIATYTYFSYVEGEVNFGDTTLIPTYGYVLMFIICTLCYAVIDMFSVAFYGTLVFLYGDIRTRFTNKALPDTVSQDNIK